MAQLGVQIWNQFQELTEEELYQVQPRPTVLMVSRLKNTLAKRGYELKTSALRCNVFFRDECAFERG
eukprot:542860-Amphidinium_carterae.1